MSKSRMPDSHEPRPRKHKQGRERIVHIEIANRRLQGGLPPSPQAYARAFEQWRKLPGAVVHLPAADLARAPDTPMPVDRDAAALFEDARRARQHDDKNERGE